MRFFPVRYYFQIYLCFLLLFQDCLFFFLSFSDWIFLPQIVFVSLTFFVVSENFLYFQLSKLNDVLFSLTEFSLNPSQILVTLEVSCKTVLVYEDYFSQRIGQFGFAFLSLSKNLQFPSPPLSMYDLLCLLQKHCNPMEKPRNNIDYLHLLPDHYDLLWTIQHQFHLLEAALNNFDLFYLLHYHIDLLQDTQNHSNQLEIAQS